MAKKFIKLNDNNEHLSLGNLFRIIKEQAKNRVSALQSELFCILFNLESINDTTVNNYCVGCRSIGTDYKQIFINRKKRYEKNKEEFLDTIIDIINILDGIIHTNITNKEEFINNSDSAYLLSKNLYHLAKNDNQVGIDFQNKLSLLIDNNKIYECLVEELIYIVLEKKQPLYEENLKMEVFEDVLNDTSISANSLKEYLSLKLREGINFDFTMRKLASNGNAYANFELGSDEYYGFVKGYPRYLEASKYLIKAAEMNHAGANYMLGNIYIRGLLGNKTDIELEKGYEYLKKSFKLGNIAASNLIGNMYYNGIHPLKKDITKAKKYYHIAEKANYVFAINNLGNIEEENKNYEKAFTYFLKSANLGESWACNKVGEYYRTGIIEKDMQKAFYYYNQALEANYRTLYHYAYYNLAKYFYLDGFEDIPKNEQKALEYLEIASENNILEATIELFIYYARIYKHTKDQEVYNYILILKDIIETHDNYNKNIKDKIETILKELKNKDEINVKLIEDLTK